MVLKQLDASYFPYKPRQYQQDFLSFIQKNIEYSIVVQAATGFGKTPLILSALLPLAIRDGRQIIWAVRTGTETDRPIEEMKKINKITGARLFGISYRGKKDMCLLLRELKLKGELGHDDVTFLCKTHQRDCKYLLNYEKQPILLDEICKEPLLYSEILRYCEERNICPYRLQSDLATYGDVVSLNYNYIINKAISWVMRRRINYRNSFLIVDEAHNLQNVNLNSDQISMKTIKNSVKEIKNFHTPKVGEIKKLLNLMLNYLSLVWENICEDDVEFDVHECIQYCAGDVENFGILLEAMRRYGLLTRRRRLAEGKAPRSSLHHLSNFWVSVLENLNTEGIVFIASKNVEGEGRNLTVEMWDMRSSQVLRDLWKDFHRCVFCSGTIKPVDSFAEIIGLQEYFGKTFPSPFTEENVLTILTENLTARGEQLSENSAKSYINAINKFIKSLKTNIAVFSASYRIQNTLLRYGLKDAVEENHRKLFTEQQGMSGKLSRKILEEFKACAYDISKGVLCATMTGRYAEGADFPGKELEGIFLVGIPFDRMTMRTRLYVEYYERVYGREKGRFYSYILPAIKRASQSLGRALRSEEDHAVLILGDNRYRRYLRFLPDFVQANYKTVNDTKGLAIAIRKFWKQKAW